MTSTVHYYSAANPTVDPNNSWTLKLETLLSQAQQGRRIKVCTPSDATFPEEYIVRFVGPTRFPILTDTPEPNFPVAWPRGTTPDLAWEYISDITWIGTAAASIELGYAEIALGSEKTELRMLAALVTALRCSAAKALNTPCINVWRPSHDMATYHDGKLALLRMAKSSANRALASMMERRDKVTMDFTQVAKFGAYFVALGAMARIAGGRNAMALGESRFAVTRLAELLGEDWSFLTRDLYIRDALLAEVWKAFPDSIGDAINSDVIGQEVVARCLITGEDLMNASILRESELRETTRNTPKRPVRIVRTAPVAALEFSPQPSEAGDTELAASPDIKYGDLVFTPALIQARPLSPAELTASPRDSVLWSPSARARLDADIRAGVAASQLISPRNIAKTTFGDDEPAPLVD